MVRGGEGMLESHKSLRMWGPKKLRVVELEEYMQVGLAMGMELVDVENPKEMLGGNSECSENSSSM